MVIATYVRVLNLHTGRELSAPEGGMRVCAVHNDPHGKEVEDRLTL